MEPYLQDPDVTLFHGDVLDVLGEMEAESVDCVVTSPPYWGLRSYLADGHDDKPKELGLESTPELYVERMVEVFREVRRVLAPHGTVWLNLGDSYASDTKGSGGLAPSPTLGIDATGASRMSEANRLRANRRAAYEPRRIEHGLKTKDLVGIPWRVAFALQADGWYLRSDIIWAKPNPMPESVTDRPTKAHEFVFLLSKNPRYFFDQEAVRERGADTNAQRTTDYYNTSDRGPRDGGNGGLDALAARMRNGQHAGRNIRSVWEIATQPFTARALGGGSDRITSPDCPVHGVPGRRASAVPDDARLDASEPPHKPSSDDRPVREQPSEPLSTGLDRDEDPGSSSSATGHNSETSRTDALSTQRDSDDARSAGDIGYTSEPPALFSTSDHTPESRSAEDSEAGGQGSDPSVQTSDRTARTSTLTGGAYAPPGQTPHGNARQRDAKSCTCKYIDHFAVFPEELARRCIAAGCPEQVCRVCGKARERVLEREVIYERERNRTSGVTARVSTAHETGREDGFTKPPPEIEVRRQTVGFTDCECSEFGWAGFEDLGKYRPGIVLDPFMGSGTVAYVARKLGRRSVGIDLSAEYLALAAKRLSQQSLFA